MEGVLERPLVAALVQPALAMAHTPAVTPMEGVLERPLARRASAFNPRNPLVDVPAATPVNTPDQMRLLRHLGATPTGLQWPGSGTTGTPATAGSRLAMEQQACRGLDAAPLVRSPPQSAALPQAACCSTGMVW